MVEEKGHDSVSYPLNPPYLAFMAIGLASMTEGSNGFGGLYG
jgi:hypothetical protein